MPAILILLDKCMLRFPTSEATQMKAVARFVAAVFPGTEPASG